MTRRYQFYQVWEGCWVPTYVIDVMPLTQELFDKHIRGSVPAKYNDVREYARSFGGMDIAVIRGRNG